MFKKVLAIALLALMLLPAGLAEDVTIDEPKSVAAQIESVETIRDKVTDGMRSNGLAYSTDDVVTVNPDGSLTVIADGVSMTVLPPFGSAAFSQDIVAQFDVYSMFDDPLTVQQLLTGDGTHIYMLDLSFATAIEVHTSKDAVSSIITDIDQMDSATLNALAEAVQITNSSSTVSVCTCGSNNFIVYDMRKSGLELIIYTSVKNNTNIDFYLFPGGDIITEDEIINTEYMLADAILTAA